MFTVLKYIALVGTFFIYTTSGVFSKLASQRDFLSLEWEEEGACGLNQVVFNQLFPPRRSKRL